MDTRSCDPVRCEALPKSAFGCEDEVILHHEAWAPGHHIHARERDLGPVIHMQGLRVERVKRS